MLIINYLFFSANFKIRSIELVDVAHASKSAIENRVEKYLDKNIFFVRSSTLREELVDISPYIKAVTIEKKLPNNIIINFEEYEPVYIKMNLSGAYLISEEGIILEIINDFEDFQIRDSDLDLLRGYGNINEEVQEEGDLDEENIEKDDGEEDHEENKEKEGEIDMSKRMEQLERERKEIVTIVDQFFGDAIDTVPEGFVVYPVVYSYSVQNYKQLEKLDTDEVEFTKTILKLDDFDNFFEEDVLRYVWESEYKFSLYFKDRRKINFSTSREVNEQVDDLKIFMENMKKRGKRFRMVDLSSELIVYEYVK